MTELEAEHGRLEATLLEQQNSSVSCSDSYKTELLRVTEQLRLTKDTSSKQKQEAEELRREMEKVGRGGGERIAAM